MEVVLDTNVLMSGIFWKGQPGRILELWADNLFYFSAIRRDIFRVQQGVATFKKEV